MDIWIYPFKNSCIPPNKDIHKVPSIVPEITFLPSTNGLSDGSIRQINRLLQCIMMLVMTKVNTGTMREESPPPILGGVL